MWNPFSKKQPFVSPVSGRIVELKEVADEVFSSGSMGNGFAIEFNGNKVVSPLAGTVVACFPTGHAIGIETSFAQIILHVGIDTVELNGEGFHLCVQQGQKVKQGDLLIEVNAKDIKEKGYDPITMVIFPENEILNNIPYGKMVKENEVIAECGKQ